MLVARSETAKAAYWQQVKQQDVADVDAAAKAVASGTAPGPTFPVKGVGINPKLRYLHSHLLIATAISLSRNQLPLGTLT